MAMVKKEFSSLSKGDSNYTQTQLKQFLNNNSDLNIKTILRETTVCGDGSILKKATVFYEDINENDSYEEDDEAHFKAMQQAYNVAAGK